MPSFSFFTGAVLALSSCSLFLSESLEVNFTGRLVCLARATPPFFLFLYLFYFDHTARFNVERKRSHFIKCVSIQTNPLDFTVTASPPWCQGVWDSISNRIICSKNQLLENNVKRVWIFDYLLSRDYKTIEQNLSYNSTDINVPPPL